MKKMGWMLIGWILLAAGGAQSAEMPLPKDRASLAQTGTMDRWSLRGEYARMERKVEMDGGLRDLLDARWYTVGLGYRLVPWLDAYAMAGRHEARIEAPSFDGSGLLWGAGLDASLWQTTFTEPAYLAGRTYLNARLEYLNAESDDQFESIEWSAWRAALSLEYEIFAGDMTDIDHYPFSLVLHAGPVFSSLDGSRELPCCSEDFESTQTAGVTAGADVYFAYNFSLGMQWERFDANTFRFGMRWDF